MKIESIIKNTNGKFFVVEFIKKDGSIRKMICRLGVKKHLKGGNKTTPNNCITVYDVINKGYRCFYPDTIINFKCGNVSYHDGQIFMS